MLGLSKLGEGEGKGVGGSSVFGNQKSDVAEKTSESKT